MSMRNRETAAGTASSAPTPPPTWSACAARVQDRAHAGPARAPSGSGSCSRRRRYVHALGALTGNQAVQQVRAGLKAIYCSAAGRWRPTPTSPAQMYPDQSLYPANSVPTVVRRINNALQRADQIEHAEGKNGHALVRADRGRRRGGLRRAAQRLRADEGDDRGGRRGRALRGPARAPRRSAATWAARCWCPTRPVHPDAGGGAAGGGRAAACPRSSSRAPTPTARDAAHQRRRRARPARSSPGERTPEGFFRVRERHRAGHRPRPRLRAVRRPALVRDLHAGPRGGAAVRRGDPRAVPGQAARLQLLALVQLEEAPRRRRPSPGSSASWARWATSSSS